MTNSKVGIIGYWFATNYGGVSSYYSLYQKVKNLGYDPFFVETPFFATDKEGTDVFSRNFFKAENFNVAQGYNINQLPELNKLADTFLLGSDQVLTSFGIKYFGKLFLMEFAEKSKKRISISASCGGDNLDCSPELINFAKSQLEKFSAVSVREYSAVDILKNKFNIQTEQIADPIFFTSPDQYRELGNKAQQSINEPYVLAYILDPTEDKKKCLRMVTKHLSMPCKIALDGRKFTHEANVQKMGMPDETLPELDYYQWINYYSNASYIVTDSYHGAVMSLILNKPFIMYANRGRGYPRFQTLAQQFEVYSRLIDNTSDLSLKKIDEKIDFDAINKKIEIETKKASNWLSVALKTDSPLHYIQNHLNIKKECMGCGACVNCCPKDALSLRPDEYGYYRSTIDPTKCINCGLCTKICPALNLPKKNNDQQPKLFEFIASNVDLLLKSSSGGVFSLLAKLAFAKNGVVVGAAWKDDYSVEHIIVDSEQDLPKLRKSKYMQSYIGNVLRDIKTKLDNGVFVLFTGCPCQVAGLKAYLGKEYDNLIMVDLLCSNAPSPQFFKKYLKDAFEQIPDYYEFRAKKEEWNANCVGINVGVGGKNITLLGAKDDDWQRVYHNHVMCSSHCENCKYQAVPRYGDLTIGDFWGISSKDSTIDTRQGISAVLCNNEKGRTFFESIPSDAIRIKKEVPLSWLGGNGYALNGGKSWAPAKRDLFYEAIKKMSFPDAVNYALKPNHGIYETLGALNFNSKRTHFSFDPTAWEEHYINNNAVLTTKVQFPKPKIYATLPLACLLEKGKQYTLKARFKIKTSSKCLTFHIKDSGSDIIQVIYNYPISQNDSQQWVEIQKTFIPDSHIYDEIMFGASQICGDSRWFVIDYIIIE